VRFVHLERCGDLSKADLEVALASREACTELLARMSVISAPGTGVAAVLSVFAGIGSMACDWLDGDLVIEMIEADEVTTVRVMTDLGGGMHEKIFRPFELRVPLVEIAQAIERTPEIIGGLTARKISWRRLTLKSQEETRRSTVPPKVGVSDASLWMLDKMQDALRAKETSREVSTPPSGDVDGGWDADDADADDGD
jgi:hypothetical protein